MLVQVQQRLLDDAGRHDYAPVHEDVAFEHLEPVHASGPYRRVLDEHGARSRLESVRLGAQMERRRGRGLYIEGAALRKDPLGVQREVDRLLWLEECVEDKKVGGEQQSQQGE